MTIFDSKPFQLNSTSNSRFCDTFDMPTWSFNKSDNFINKAGLSSPKRSKKKVSFADDKGQDLIHVLTIDNSHVPDLKPFLLFERPSHHSSKPKPISETKPVSVQPCDWVTSFIQPASIYGRFKSDLSKQKVKLATAIIKKTQTDNEKCEFEMTGVIKLVNLCFEKRVFVRLSTDCAWTSYSDFDAKYKNSFNEFLPNDNTNCDIDEFEFQISLPNHGIDESTYLEFVVGFETPNIGDYWDNNNGKNYRIDYCQVAMDNLSNSISSSNAYTRDYKPNLESFQSGYTGYRAWNHFSEESNFY